LTVGFAFLFQQAALDIWGGDNRDIIPPAGLTQSAVIGGLYLPGYRIFMIAVAAAIGLILWLVMEKTRLGAAVRATVDDAQMARGVGIDTSRISMFIFALGAFLAALGGVIGGAFLGVYPGLDFQILPIAFAVVIIGGMGSLGGAAIGALLVGIADNFGKALFPEVSYFTLYAPMALILAVKPTGLFGRERAGAMVIRNKVWVVVGVWIALGLIAPFTNSFVMLLITWALILAILAMSLDILLAFAGLP